MRYIKYVHRSLKIYPERQNQQLTEIHDDYNETEVVTGKIVTDKTSVAFSNKFLLGQHLMTKESYYFLFGILSMQCKIYQIHEDREYRMNANDFLAITKYTGDCNIEYEELQNKKKNASRFLNHVLERIRKDTFWQDKHEYNLVEYIEFDKKMNEIKFKMTIPAIRISPIEAKAGTYQTINLQDMQNYMNSYQIRAHLIMSKHAWNANQKEIKYSYKMMKSFYNLKQMNAVEARKIREAINSIGFQQVTRINRITKSFNSIASKQSETFMIHSDIRSTQDTASAIALLQRESIMHVGELTARMDIREVAEVFIRDYEQDLLLFLTTGIKIIKRHQEVFGITDTSIWLAPQPFIKHLKEAAHGKSIRMSDRAGQNKALLMRPLQALQTIHKTATDIQHEEALQAARAELATLLNEEEEEITDPMVAEL